MAVILNRAGPALSCILILAGLRAAQASDLPVEVKRSTTEWSLANGLIQVTLDAKTGNLKALSNGVKNWSTDLPGIQVYLVGATEPLKFDAGAPRLTSAVLDDGASVEVTRLDPSGVKLAIVYSLSAGQPYIVAQATLQNNGDRKIRLLTAWEGWKVENPGGGEVGLAFPYGVPGLPPESDLAAGVPLLSPSIDLVANWFNLAGEEYSLGIGYVDPRGLAVLNRIQRKSGTASLTYKFLDFTGSPYYEILHRNDFYYPLSPGTVFQTGKWMLTLHENTWHATADAYKALYDQTYAELGEVDDLISPRAREADIWAGAITKGWSTFSPDSCPKDFQFDTHMVPLMDELLKWFDARASAVIVSNNHVGPFGKGDKATPLPDFHRCSTWAGGREAMKRMVEQLKPKGFAGILGYTYFWTQHPYAETAMPEAAPSIPSEGKSTPQWICLDNDVAFGKWRDTIIPGMASLGINAVYFDMGCWTPYLSENPGSNNGGTTLGILTQGTRGIHRLVREYHRQLGQGSILVTEAKQDIIGRYYDIWHGPVSEYVRYTHPEHPCVTQPYPDLNLTLRHAQYRPIKTLNETAAYALLTGMQLIATDQAYKDPEPVRAFVRIRRQLRDEKAPGYPFGFRDVVGVSTTDKNLDARSFRSPEGITIVYHNWSDGPIEGTINVDGKALGLEKVGKQSKTVSVKPGASGYFVCRPK